MDFAFFTALYNWARINPVIAAALIALWIAGNLWRGLPEAQRKRYEQRYPRWVGMLRAVLGLLPDPLVVLRALGYSVALGRPHPGSVPSTDPPVKPLHEVTDERIRALQDAHTSRLDERDTIPPPEPEASGPVPSVTVGDERGSEGFVDSAALRYLAVIALCLFAAVALPLASCASFSPQFRMVDPEIVSDPKFGECARTGTTLSAGHTQFAMLASVCVQRVGDAGVVIDPPDEPVVKDAGTQLTTNTETDQ